MSILRDQLQAIAENNDRTRWPWPDERMTPDDYTCRTCHASMRVTDGLDPLDEDVRFCHGCAIDEIEALTKMLRVCWGRYGNIKFETWLKAKRNLAESVDV